MESFMKNQTIHHNTVGYSISIPLTLLYLIILSYVSYRLILACGSGRKKITHQTLLLIVCLLWSIVRTILFSLYVSKCNDFFLDMPIIAYWILFALPICLQYVMISIIVIFFIQIYLKSRFRNSWRKKRILMRVLINLSIIAQFMTSIIYCIVTKNYVFANVPFSIISCRVFITDSLFILIILLLIFIVTLLIRLSQSDDIFEMRGTTRQRTIIVLFLLIILFTSRIVYNMLAITVAANYLPNFGHGWLDVSDEADLVYLTNVEVVTALAIIFFIWEIIPTFAILFLFDQRKRRTIDDLLINESDEDESELEDSYISDITIQSINDYPSLIQL
ncbi:hypothetical protein SNEBB_000091 [Seison nebaliae]|nr:hypothetical protein SNEBB_000091 [Seison nebaliae]